MRSLELQEFISTLEGFSFLEEFDRSFLSQFVERVSLDSGDEEVGSALRSWIEEIFADRWKMIADTPNDYTRNAAGANEAWIRLARRLSRDVDKPFLQYLMPTILNTVDPNNFARLVDCKKVSDLYLGEDDRTLYSMEGLLQRLTKKQTLYTYNPYHYKENRGYIPRSLSLKEMIRIRSKLVDEPVDVLGVSYPSFWDSVLSNIIPELHKSGEIPKQLLQPLLEWVERYFIERREGSEETRFRVLFLEWLKYLQECSVDDMSCLYGQKITVNGNSIYLLTLLMDCMEGDDDSLPDKMKGIAHWLCQYDPALVSGIPELKTIYSELASGPYFLIDQLREWVKLLKVGASSQIETMLSAFAGQLSLKTSIDLDLISTLANIYRQRWLEVRGKVEDYTRFQGEPNARWIRLAQLIQGAGYLKQNYYQFLMPTLRVHQDPVTRGSITDYPLSHYILASNGRSLIYLGHCEQHYKVSGTFYNCNTVPPSPLSLVELSRLPYASERFHRYIKILGANEENDPPLSKNTVLAVHRLVNESLYPIGLQFARDYNESQRKSAEMAYLTFCEFVNRLPREEKNRLFAQRIFFEGKYLSFKRILADTQADVCVALCGQYFAQMVMDYAPYLKFRPELEGRLVRIDNMRAQSRQKVFSEYQHINDQEAKRRIQVLAATLMNQGLQFALLGESVSIWDCTHHVNSEMKNIFQMIRPMIDSGDYTHARHIYMQLVESVVAPALAEREKSWFTWLIRSNATQSCLASIADGTLFTKQDAWFQPTFLMSSLSAILPRLDAKTSVRVISFLEDLIRTFAQSKNTSLKEIRVNIKFTELLRSLPDVSRKQVLAALDVKHQFLEDKPFCGAFHDFILIRLIALASRPTGAQRMVFFANTQSTETLSHRKLNALKAALSLPSGTEGGTMQDIIALFRSRIDKMGKRICDEQVKVSMRVFLSQIKMILQPFELSQSPKRGGVMLRSPS